MLLIQMLNCILGMVEKTQRALGILQQRHNTANNMRTTEELVGEVQRRAEVAVNEVKMAAIEEIRQALGDRNNHQNEARMNLERAILDLRNRGENGSNDLLKLSTINRKEDENSKVSWLKQKRIVKNTATILGNNNFACSISLI